MTKQLLTMGLAGLVAASITGCVSRPHRAETDDGKPDAAILDVFPASAVQLPAANRGRTRLSSKYTPSGSLWGKHLREETVFNFEIRHLQDQDNSFSLRIGRGGQLYSLRGPFGESIPPQGIGNPWNDEVWQFVSVCGKYNGLGSLASGGAPPDEALERLKASPYASSYFIHNSGAYMATRVDSGTITLSCDVRLDQETPGTLDIILRDSTQQEWKTFGTLRVAASGISFNEKLIAAGGAGAWYRITLAFELGPDSDEQVIVTVRPADGETATVAVPFAETDVTAFTWLGLSAGGDEAGVINIDNLSVKRVAGEKTSWPVREDFEDYADGQIFGHVVGGDKTKGADAFVSDSVAASGRNSLEIHDAPGLPGGWPPMVRLGIQSTEAGSLYCPLLAAAIPADGRSYRTVNWGMVPQLKTIHRSPILYYVQTRDAGDGVIEITYVVHNFSARDDIVFDWLNAPWGGTRVTSLPFHYVSSPEGELRDQDWIKENAIAIDVRKTGGWNLSCATEEPDSPSLALVFGRDKHLETERQKVEQGVSYCQIAHSIYRDWTSRIEDWEKRPENAWRNYDIAVVIPRFRLAPRTTIWYRSYLVVNRRDRTIELAKSLVDQVDYGLVTFDPATTPLVPVKLPRQPRFKLFAKPVPGTMPLFLVENAETGQEVITTDPYIFVPQEKLDLCVPPEHPHHDYYNKAVGYSMDRNNSRWKRLLGYGYVDQPAGDDSYQRLSDLLDPAQFPEATTYHLDLWVKARGE